MASGNKTEASLLGLFIVPPFLSLTSQIFRARSIKKSWDTINLVLVLFAIICGFLRRTNHGGDVGSSSLYPRSDLREVVIVEPSDAVQVVRQLRPLELQLGRIWVLLEFVWDDEKQQLRDAEVEGLRERVDELVDGLERERAALNECERQEGFVEAGVCGLGGEGEEVSGREAGPNQRQAAFLIQFLAQQFGAPEPQAEAFNQVRYGKDENGKSSSIPLMFELVRLIPITLLARLHEMPRQLHGLATVALEPVAF
ncbi:hypothetical protein NL676_024585 [Syzygium grande]|nr:hypothetical protein NL676_024585 [Syzygium grande]